MDDVSTVQSDQMDINKILDQFKLLNGRIKKIEQKVDSEDNRQLLSLKSVHSEVSSTQQQDSVLLLPIVEHFEALQAHPATG